ncbi:MAG: ATP-binding protein [Blastochloris sp.]|nr:ATP-binding protein [Blastochloris sp.]
MVASKRLGSAHEDHLVRIPGGNESILKTAVMYGANGAGKSNLFRALDYTRSVALRVRKKNTGTKRVSFRLGAVQAEPSSFDLQFMAGEKLYRFGFKVDDERITEEWLAEVKGERLITLYERVTRPDGEVVVDTSGFVKAGPKLRALATVGGPTNVSFLATIRANLKAVDYGDDVAAVIRWFEHSLKLVTPDSTFSALGPLLADNTEFAAFAGDFLKHASTGVDHLHVDKKEITEEQLRSVLPEAVVTDVLKDLEENESTIIQLGEDSELLIERGKEHHFYQITIHAAHQRGDGDVTSFNLAEESDGTKRLLHLIPALHYLQKQDAVFVIDEIDRSMHPMLVWKFLEFFLNDATSGQRQIIVTTHESNLLDLELLRRDEIWFVEKDRNGATTLYPLTDFKVRQDLEIRKHYLQGRFGAVPFLGNLERLTEGTKNEPDRPSQAPSPSPG